MDIAGLQCTGTLIATSPRIRKTYQVLTAYHCLGELRGINENTPKGTLIKGEFRIGVSTCAPVVARKTGIISASNARFIAGNELADWALLYIDENNFRTNTLKDEESYALRSNTDLLNPGVVLRTLHHGRGTILNLAESQIGALAQSSGPMVRKNQFGQDVGFARFADCTGNNCSHYRLNPIIGGTIGGASGSSAFSDFAGGRLGTIRAVQTNGSESTCIQYASIFGKIREDGRVQCSLKNGRSYINDGNTPTGETCDDSQRPVYSLSSSPQRAPLTPPGNRTIPSSSIGAGGTGLSSLLILMIIAGYTIVLHRRKIAS